MQSLLDLDINTLHEQVDMDTWPTHPYLLDEYPIQDLESPFVATELYNNLLGRGCVI